MLTRKESLAMDAPPADTETLIRAHRDRMIAAAGLSEREVEVLNLLLLGRAHGDIATALEISERTSRFHQGNILRKLGAESRFDLQRLFAEPVRSGATRSRPYSRP